MVDVEMSQSAAAAGQDPNDPASQVNPEVELQQ